MPDVWTQFAPPSEDPATAEDPNNPPEAEGDDGDSEGGTEPPLSIETLIRLSLERFGSRDFQAELDQLAEKLVGSKMLPIPLILKRLSNLVGDELAEGHPRLQLAIHNMLHPDKAFPLPDSKDIYENLYDSNYMYTRRPQQKHFSKRVLGSWTHYNNNITDPRTLTNRKILARTRAMEDRMACFGLAADFAKEENFDHREVEVCSRAYQTHGVRYVLTVYLDDENQLKDLDDDFDIWRTLWVPYSSNPAMYHYIRVGWNLCLVSEVGLRFDDESQAPWDESENGTPHIIEYLREHKVRFKVWPVFDYQKDMPEAKIALDDIVEALDTVDATDWLSLFTVSFAEAAKIADSISTQQVPLDQIQNTYYASLDVMDLPPVGGPLDKLLTPVNISVYKKILPWVIALIMVASIAATSYCAVKKIGHQHVQTIYSRWGAGSMDDIALSPRKRIIVMNHPAGKFESRLGFGPAKLMRLLRRTAHTRQPLKKELLGADTMVGDLLQTDAAKKVLLGDKYSLFDIDAFVVHYLRNWKVGMGMADIIAAVMGQTAEFGYMRFPVDKYPVKKLWKEVKKVGATSGAFLVIQVKIKGAESINSQKDLEFTHKNLAISIPSGKGFFPYNAAETIYNAIRTQHLVENIPFTSQQSINNYCQSNAMRKIIQSDQYPKIEILHRESKAIFLTLDPSVYSVRDLWGLFLSSPQYLVRIHFSQSSQSSKYTSR